MEDFSNGEHSKTGFLLLSDALIWFRETGQPQNTKTRNYPFYVEKTSKTSVMLNQFQNLVHFIGLECYRILRILDGYKDLVIEIARWLNIYQIQLTRLLIRRNSHQFVSPATGFHILNNPPLPAFLKAFGSVIDQQVAIKVNAQCIDSYYFVVLSFYFRWLSWLHYHPYRIGPIEMREFCFIYRWICIKYLHTSWDLENVYISLFSTFLTKMFYWAW